VEFSIAVCLMFTSTLITASENRRESMLHRAAHYSLLTGREYVTSCCTLQFVNRQRVCYCKLPGRGGSMLFQATRYSLFGTVQKWRFCGCLLWTSLNRWRGLLLQAACYSSFSLLTSGEVCYFRRRLQFVNTLEVHYFKLPCGKGWEVYYFKLHDCY